MYTLRTLIRFHTNFYIHSPCKKCLIYQVTFRVAYKYIRNCNAWISIMLTKKRTCLPKYLPKSLQKAYMLTQGVYNPTKYYNILQFYSDPTIYYNILHFFYIFHLGPTISYNSLPPSFLPVKCDIFIFIIYF